MLLSKFSSPNHILVVSVSLVAAIRVTSYYNEQLSQDLAKMIPFALLGIFLVDATFFSVQEKPKLYCRRSRPIYTTSNLGVNSTPLSVSSILGDCIVTTIRYSMVRWRSYRNRWPGRIRRAAGGTVLFLTFLIGFWILMGACNSNIIHQ